tara:strand:- start:134 stop:373 length:240 start_codon:yes stop_codon:yes gene_type:complete
MARSSKKNKRMKNRINTLLEINVNKVKKVKSYNINRGVTVEKGYFNLNNKITTNNILQPSNKAYKTVGLLGLKKTYKGI